MDLCQKLCFPSEIATTNLRPDFVPWSSSMQKELAADAEQYSWKVEVDCIGFVGKATTRLLKELGIRGLVQCHAIKSLSNVAEQASWWLWVKRGDLGPNTASVAQKG